MDNVQLKTRNYFGSSRILNHLSYFSRIYTTLYENISEENSVSLALLPNYFIQLTPRRLPSRPSFYTGHVIMTRSGALSERKKKKLHRQYSVACMATSLLII